MTYPEGFWTFLHADGTIYGSSVGKFDTPMQAWADFYSLDPVKVRREAEKAGSYCRPAQAGDLDAWKVEDK